MNEDTLTKAIAIFHANHGLLRAQQAVRMGIAPRTLYELYDSGVITRESRGLYRLTEMEISSYHDLVQVAMRIPNGVVCLISALSFHELTTQVPRQVYIALPSSAEKPRLEYPPLRLFWLSQKAYLSGIEQHVLEGVPVSIYCIEKTIADSFKFRNKIGLDIALEALRTYRRRKEFNIRTLLDYARIDRVERIMKPYLEMLRD
jgi:predicted transcriptional regulator of viral defense system